MRLAGAALVGTTLVVLLPSTARADDGDVVLRVEATRSSPRDRHALVSLTVSDEGISLVLSTEATCIERTVRVVRRANGAVVRLPVDGDRQEVPCATRPAPEKPVFLVVGEEAEPVALGATDKRGSIVVPWSAVEGLGSKAASSNARLQFADEDGPVFASLDLEPARQRLGREALLRAKQLAADDNVDDALVEVLGAEALGLDATEVRAAIDAAPASRSRKAAAAAADEQRRADEANARAQRAKELGLIEAALPVTVGEDWLSAEAALKKAATKFEYRPRPFGDVVVASVSIDAGVVRTYSIVIETCDGARVASIDVNLDRPWSGLADAKRLLTAIRRSLGTAWRLGPVHSDGMPSVYFDAVRVGERRLRVRCGAALGGCKLTINDAWMMLPTGYKDVSAGWLAWNASADTLAAGSATGVPRWQLPRLATEALETVRDGLAVAARSAKNLSPRSRDAFSDFARTVLDEHWFAAQFKTTLDSASP